MIESDLPVIAALGLGVLTSISPCPMASHAAAVSVLVRGAGSWKAGLVVGASYALGRAAAYAALAWILSAGIFKLGPLVRKVRSTPNRCWAGCSCWAACCWPFRLGCAFPAAA